MRFKTFVNLLFLLLATLCYGDLQITVEPDKRWGDWTHTSVKELCKNVVLHFQEQLREEHKITGKLTIVYTSGNNPIIWYRHHFGGGANEYKIGLKTQPHFRGQMIYQFGHEFCHLMLNHDTTHPNNPNIWFFESLCELANVWVLRRMSETWAHSAPHEHWSWPQSRKQLADYAKERMNRDEVQYKGTGAEWLQEWEDKVRADGARTPKSKSSQLSYKFLPIFEKHPEAWNAVRQISGSTGKMSEFMRDWYKKVDIQDKVFVKDIAKIMGISVENTVAISNDSINADVNKDGYVDLSDVRIVRSAIQNSVSYDTDVNKDGKTDEQDVLIVKAKAHAAIAAAAPSLIRRKKVTTWGALKSRYVK
ncbi:hypothetical protein C6500_18820 [Candidatus Poribacteria bacterium]|nr:MAG: hypothetical protein C6500_18820 [Candidatus Poribacteria bacterium]